MAVSLSCASLLRRPRHSAGATGVICRNNNSLAPAESAACARVRRDRVGARVMNLAISQPCSFDSIRGISGGGATSTFLQAYPEKQKNEILDALFRPGSGASLDILKVEIASDDQTTDGCEAGHWRRRDEPVNCSRGYEWALMREAVARNPNITLYGLPRTWPGWLGFGTANQTSDRGPNPYANVTAPAEYITAWVQCAKTHHNLNIAVLGLWNESPWVPDYILALRKSLDQAGFLHTSIVAADGDIASAAKLLSSNSTVAAALAGGCARPALSWGKRHQRA